MLIAFFQTFFLSKHDPYVLNLKHTYIIIYRCVTYIVFHVPFQIHRICCEIIFKRVTF